MTTKPFNYSKWDNIELSDDESDLHPNIDKDSWFRLKHRTRLEREAKEDEDIKKFEALNSDDQSRLLVLKLRIDRLLKSADNNDAEDDIDALKGEVAEIEVAVSSRNKFIHDARDKRKWNIDNICKVTEEKTIIGNVVTSSLKAADFQPTGATERLHNVYQNDVDSELPGDANSASVVQDKPKKQQSTLVARPEPDTRENFAIISYNDYVIANEDLLENYSEIQSMEDTKVFLHKHCDILLHEHSQSYMLLSCLEDEMNGKTQRAKLVCRQSQILSHIHELGTSMHRDPRDVILPFFKRIEESSYSTAFFGAVEDFRKKIQERAIVKRSEMDSENRKKGPGGLDPMEVFESLPQVLQEAFESQDIQSLQDALAAMNPEVAKEIMKKCVMSGLWVPKDSTEFE